MSGQLDNDFVIPLLLRQYSDFFTVEEREDFDDEEIQYELFLDLVMGEGESVCELEWDSGEMAGTSWMKKIGDYYFVNDDIEPLYGSFSSIKSAFDECNTCSYISDAVTNIYIKKPVETVDWIIVANDNHTLMINSEEYIIQNERLLKIITYKDAQKDTQNDQELNKICEICNNVLDDNEAECGDTCYDCTIMP